MILTLTLTPEKETRLQDQARRAGLPLDEYALRVLDQAADAPAPASSPGEHRDGSPNAERIARFQKWADGHGKDTPHLSDEAISREAIYGNLEPDYGQRL